MVTPQNVSSFEWHTGDGISSLRKSCDIEWNVLNKQELPKGVST